MRTFACKADQAGHRSIDNRLAGEYGIHVQQALECGSVIGEFDQSVARNIGERATRCPGAKFVEGSFPVHRW